MILKEQDTDMENFKVGILGAGHIAEKMAVTLANMEGVETYSVASRDKEKADRFADKYGFTKAYGSYEELVNDREVQLIYIATPHSFHYEHAKLCLSHDIPVLCEKAFTANAKQARELVALSAERNVFISEAIWTRYMPLSLRIKNLLDSGIIGKPHTITANLCYPISDKERIKSPLLAGGALLDIGVYLLNFAAMYFGKDIVRIVSSCSKLETGVDAQDSITLYFNDERIAVLNCSVFALSDRSGVISGDKGFLVVENINNPQSVKIYNNEYSLIEEIQTPLQITGFEYEVQAAINSIKSGKIETEYMPHSETVRMMEQMDALRKVWGIAYPFE